MTPEEFLAAVRSPDRKTQLEALRDNLAAELADPRAGMAIAPMHKELREVLTELAALNPPKKDAELVDLSAALARKQAAAG